MFALPKKYLSCVGIKYHKTAKTQQLSLTHVLVQWILSKEIFDLFIPNTTSCCLLTCGKRHSIYMFFLTVYGEKVTLGEYMDMFDMAAEEIAHSLLDKDFESPYPLLTGKLYVALRDFLWIQN